MKHISHICSFCAVIVLASSPVMAQTLEFRAKVCDQRTRVIGNLAQKYNETPVAIGVTTTGSMVEVLTTGDGGTWTIILSDPNGTSCLVAAGEGWRTLQQDSTKLDPRT